MSNHYFLRSMSFQPDALKLDQREPIKDIAQGAQAGLRMEQLLGDQAKSPEGNRAASVLEAITTVAMQELDAAVAKEANREPDSQKVFLDKILARWDKFSDVERHHLKETFPDLLSSMQ